MLARAPTHAPHAHTQAIRLCRQNLAVQAKAHSSDRFQFQVPKEEEKEEEKKKEVLLVVSVRVASGVYPLRG